ncbi:hypothetical protein F9C07_2135754 [Aspergillus flavus]|uniref:Fungal calcium binding protein domain-containing protein n=3 Tax=Aspergillus subgen. Circumdati TaxID=2720871 RepID=A0A7U2QX56_ASPFN|nr:uncharacterized protein G4B84_001610 [Aspergillus flavus NRRL3357]KAJ1710458.1 hypothetical protein NYO67_7384 [Aspergillus flavus]KOC14485.1 hypothetical protein AFLA70_5g008361 [Aspergillus flavus AF70]OOO13223.1 hypothetical protein OAory_01009720 [Aspergillus oryzae]QMW26365.1 hypothetical protein G4B84_001610 [Aspergillus flavus NRRL3357]QMW38445.1 hypothetical protein G4B11_001681 [Aspergillus flavus]
MRVSSLALALCASVAMTAPTETPDLHNILQAFNTSKIVQDAGPVLESLLVTGNCNIPACFQQLIPAVQECNAAIVGGGSDIASDLECVSSVVADLVPSQSNNCAVCVGDAISTIRSQLEKGSQSH